MIESPQSFIVSTECSKAAEQHGFRRRLGETDGWAAFQSTTAQGTIWLAAEGPAGPWFLALDHGGVIREMGLAADPLQGPGLSRFRFGAMRELYSILPRIYRLAASLPDAPLRTFQTKVQGLPKTTETERLVVQRIGQDIFRTSLLEYWNGQCSLTGITDPALLRASHIIPWKDCSCDAERLDVHNGLLLSALWDAAFDRGLVTFHDDGRPEFSPALSEASRAELRWREPIPLTPQHREKLAWHRTNHFNKTDVS
ncbi:HNH endonuclease [Pelagibius litoralis]|uniref:HNH endonuclease n=1 Tax=Pelagibius litoralis TaxID=374515 RepID=A0A967F1C5_9PROT|nr:HNH endonuclease [Pelagibius litoralis]NIA71257.1 HNH endonuclease [Pelagibius litoralis]